MEDLLGLLIGIGLAAACGFRVFVPLLGLALAANSGHLELASGFEWLASPAAVAAFGVATVLEVMAYYTPWLDNLLDSLAAPAAVVAGVMVTASVTGDMSPFLRWSLAVIAGGGVAALVQGGTTLTRASSSLATGGLGNPLVSTGELVGASTMTVAAMFLPLLAFVAVVALSTWIGWRLLRGRHARPGEPDHPAPPALPRP